MCGNRPKRAIGKKEERSVLGLADASGIRQNSLEHGIKFARKRADDLQHFRGGCLLLYCLGEVGCAFGEVGCSLAQFVSNRAFSMAITA